MTNRIRTLNFLPEIFKTNTNSQFLRSSLDQLTAQPNTQRVEGYIGSKFGYGVRPTDQYVIEPTKTRNDYQLEPGVVFRDPTEGVANDFIGYPGIIDALSLAGSSVSDHSRLFENEYYSWDSFTDLDKLVNFNQYYWLPNGAPAVSVDTDDVSLILGKKTHTAPNGVVLSNGLKVNFSATVRPAKYRSGNYYVEGVGESITLVSESTLVSPEAFTTGQYIPFDTTPFGSTSYDSTKYVPASLDYITINRAAENKNAWSRSNRWFHIDVIKATATYNGTPGIISSLITSANNARRPIIEFYPDLKMFDSGSTGKAAVDFVDTRTTDAFTQVAGKKTYAPDVAAYSTYTASVAGTTGTSTSITVLASEISGILEVGQYVADSASVLPSNAKISAITGTSTLTITVSWSASNTVAPATNVSLVASDITLDNYTLHDGARIIFASDTNASVRSKIYVARFSSITGTSTPVITLTVAEDGNAATGDQTVAYRGYNSVGKNFYFNGSSWVESQQKTTVNQTPLFDIVDTNGVSFSDRSVYVGSSFEGCTLFGYGIGTGTVDPVLGFPLAYSTVNNVGDIKFNVTLNSDTFDYVSGTSPVTAKVNTGYVVNGTSRELGWRPSVTASSQYQVFDFTAPTLVVKCDVPAAVDSVLHSVQVFIGSVYQDRSSYSVNVTGNETVVTFATLPTEPVQVLVASVKVSSTAYFQIPDNLSNNPLNEDITSVDVGDLRSQYLSVFYNNPSTTGNVFGTNNTRDLGNLVKWGTKIVKHSAPLTLVGALLRKQNHNLIDALAYSSKEYATFKSYLVDIVNNTEYSVYQTPASILDDALGQITASKSDASPFFWSDMIPSKSPYVSNTYKFRNAMDVTVYPLVQVYDFSKANYNGVLVYLNRVIDGVTRAIQLVRGVDYTVSTEASSLEVTRDLVAGDSVTVAEFNQTYGSYIPNTPTKLGLYPATIPHVTLDSGYIQPTYFLVGHDGSFTRLYGEYDETTGLLQDFRDQVLFEFETRVYNNLKLGSSIPLQETDITPGYFRESAFSDAEYAEMYYPGFLNWVGQNRINYKTQTYNKSIPATFNYRESGFKGGKVVQQGNWRGIYIYLYDTTQPDAAPWEMIGHKNKPVWWESRYGVAPYTSDNLVLWNDMAAGIDYNGGEPVVRPQYVRAGLLDVLPVDSSGKLILPLDSSIGHYNSKLFQRDWIVGDMGPAEFSYRRSSAWPFDLMRMLSLAKPAKFYGLGVDLDNYRFRSEFGQYLVDNRSHLNISNIEVYGSGTPKTSYLNWIVDYEKQSGVDATAELVSLLNAIDVRLVYRVAGFSDKNMMKFYVEKSSTSSASGSLMIPDESYSVMLYDNQPFDRIVYSGVVVQLTSAGFKVYGNSQTTAFFKTATPIVNGNYTNVTVEGISVKVANDYYATTQLVPYGTEFYSIQEVAQFLASYGKYLENQGVVFDQIERGIHLTWTQMVGEFLYWSQIGWEIGSITTINPAAQTITIDKDSTVVQPLTVQQQNFILNDNLYPIKTSNLEIVRDGTSFSARPLLSGDTVAYGQFNVSNFEHGVVFDNVTVFDDVIYNLVTGVRQSRITVKGTKTAEWNGTVDAQGFILNQDNVKEWTTSGKYTKGEIVKYKNKFWSALEVVQPSTEFDTAKWKQTPYESIQKGLLANPQTRAFESTLYYDTTRPNLESDADLLSFSLIGYRPRDFLAGADLSDVAQINVYQNIIKNKGTNQAINAFKGASLAQGTIDYTVHENWAIKTAEFGGVLNNNFVDIALDESQLTGNPAIIGLSNTGAVTGVQQQVGLTQLINYGAPVTSPDILVTTSTSIEALPSAGYVNFDDVKMASYFYSGLKDAVNRAGTKVAIDQLYVRDYVWLANYLEQWQIYTPVSLGAVTAVKNNLNGTATITFATAHGLTKLQPVVLVNIGSSVDGYYVVSQVVNTTSIVVSVALSASINSMTSNGVGFKLESRRVAQPADIAKLPLSTTEFESSLAWVDDDSTGNWAVYKKTENFVKTATVAKDGSTKFGSAVATTPTGYLITDSSLGYLYRYSYNALSKTYSIVQAIQNGTSFGTSIAHQSGIYAVSEPTSANPKVYLYQLTKTSLVETLSDFQAAIPAQDGSTNWGSAIELSGDTNWLFISATDLGRVYVYQKSRITGQYTKLTYITVSGVAAADQFGSAIATDFFGRKVIIGASGSNYSGSVTGWGKSYVFDRATQTFETRYAGDTYSPQQLDLVWQPTNTVSMTAVATSSTGTYANMIQLASGTPVVGEAVVFTGQLLSSGAIAANTVYYVVAVNGTRFSISTARGGAAITLAATTGTMGVTFQRDPLIVTVNGNELAERQYFTTVNSLGNLRLTITATTGAGDIVSVDGALFVKSQVLNAATTPRIGTAFGKSIDATRYASEIIVGAPFDVSTENNEGAVYCYVDAGSSYGLIVGTSATAVTTPRTITLNGYAVKIPAGNATVAASAINAAAVTNVAAAAQGDKLVIQLIQAGLAPTQKLSLRVFDEATAVELGITQYTLTQVVQCPRSNGSTQFGSVVKFNESKSFIATAPVSASYSPVRFDFIDDLLDNDTVFDNNATSWIDSSKHSGTAYVFDYLPAVNETITNPGQYAYAQSFGDVTVTGPQPKFGSAVDFSNTSVLIGSALSATNGQVSIFTNANGTTNWSTYRAPSATVDVSLINEAQLFATDNARLLEALDYIDPLQGKILGAARENIDVISNTDPAGYSTKATGLIWGKEKLGHIWFDTTNTRFVNYHQNDVAYDSEFWGTVFPGSDVAVYTWIESTVPPVKYTGTGTPLNFTDYSEMVALNASGEMSSVYYFWVRGTNQVFTNAGKTLADTTIAKYIADPATSGVSFLAAINPRTFAIYNASESISAQNSALHIGYALNRNDDAAHTEFALIRSNVAEDFVPGVPSVSTSPQSLYDRMLDSLCGADESGDIVPNPFLPDAVKTGISARPRQSFFRDRFGALKNYFQYANSVLIQHPITEMRTASFLFAEGAVNPSTNSAFYSTEAFWDYANWWATGYSDNTKPALQVSTFSDLSTLAVQVGTVVAVAANASGRAETYILESSGWTRIGLSNGTIQLKSSLWDYSSGRIGFGANFYDNTPFDQYPSEETRSIVRALNEEIYTSELQIHRNKSLILLFEYIQSEAAVAQPRTPWLSKTSLVDVAHTVRTLDPITTYQLDNQDFLDKYLNEVKPFHVVIKEFLYKYSGNDTYYGALSDFDLPAKYDSGVDSFVSPQLVKSQRVDSSQFLADSAVWQDSSYTEWAAVRGMKLAGAPSTAMTSLNSYISYNSPTITVSNVNGFPVTGTILVDSEMIGYSVVDKATNTLSGLTRGVGNTELSVHYPGQTIYMDLPAVMVQFGGRKYSTVPTVRAVVDTAIHSAPIVEAELVALVNNGAVIGVTVVNPGLGYEVTPDIVFDPVLEETFDSRYVDPMTNTVTVASTGLLTGDIVTYVEGPGTTVSGLVSGQQYYVSVLETSPGYVIAFYGSYLDCLNDSSRIELLSSGQGTHTLTMAATASCITTAAPVRESSVTMRFDRIAYGSKITDWVPGSFYSSFYTGTYHNTDSTASSSNTLQNVSPAVGSLLASAQGVALEVTDVANRLDLVWSARVRTVNYTVAGNSSVVVSPATGGAANLGTIGFYEGMPVKFDGAAFAGLTIGTTYYVAFVYDDSSFALSAAKARTQASDIVAGQRYVITNAGTSDFTLIGAAANTIGTVFTASGSTSGTGAVHQLFILTSGTAPAAGTTLYVGKEINTASLTVSYPGIETVTATSAATNAVTVPLTASGSGGTRGFYTGLPIEFIGSTFGGIAEHAAYYVTSVLDLQRFTISKRATPVTTQVTATSSTGNVVTCVNAAVLKAGTPVVFSNMQIAGSAVTTFGGLSSSSVYYVSAVVSGSTFTVSASLNGPVLALTNVAAGTDTGCTLVSQAQCVQLSDATGSCTLNVNLPVSPGQIDGQRFTMYRSSTEFFGVTGTLSGTVTAPISATLATSNRIVLSDAASATLSSVYVNMPITVSASIGGLTSGTTYYVASSGTTQVTVSATTSGTNQLTCDSTTGLYVGMPLIFSGSSFGGLTIGQTYYVASIVSGTKFTVSATSGGAVQAITSGSGSMVGAGSTFIQVASTLGGAVLGLSSSVFSGAVMNQAPGAAPVFDVQYRKGGYIVDIPTASTGYVVGNVITVDGSVLGGVSGTNDLKMTVKTIGADGEVQAVIREGSPASSAKTYFFKVTSANTVDVYADQLLTVPVSGADFSFSGAAKATITATSATDNSLTASTLNGFSLYDPVVFTGQVPSSIVLGKTYYIYSLSPLKICTTVSNPATVVTMSSVSGLAMAMTSPGDYAILPEPFTFDRSLVRYNNRVYQCVVSNNDAEFVFGKWEQLTSDSRRLNALDRIVSYYQPTDDMPGKSLGQLVDGITYPNSTYMGNSFDPASLFPIDTVLSDQPFYPSGIALNSVVWDGTKYVAIANNSDYSATVSSSDLSAWSIDPLTTQPVGFTDIAYSNGVYVATTSGSTSPIYLNTDSTAGWKSASGEYTPWDATGFGTTAFDVSSLSVDSTALNSVTAFGTAWVAVGDNIVYSNNLYTWNQVKAWTGSLKAVAPVVTASFSGLVAVGTTGTSSAILISVDGQSWTTVSSLSSSVTLNAVTSNSTTIVAVGDNGACYTSPNGGNWSLAVSTGSSLNGLAYGNGVFVAVGIAGTINTSVDGQTWISRSSHTTADLQCVTFNTARNEFLAVGKNNTILRSTDGIIWTTASLINQSETLYEVRGDAFASGYGPEELVPGYITDSLSMMVTTRPGTNWDDITYQHVGYNVVSKENPAAINQTVFSFAGQVQVPAQVTVSGISASSGLSTTLYNTSYSVNWVTQAVTFVTAPLTSGFSAVRIDVSEVGNGDQLIKSSTLRDPIRVNDVSGLSEIYLPDTHYVSVPGVGPGVLRPGYQSIEITATATDANENTVTVSDVSNLTVNSIVQFSGAVFGGLSEDTVYYVREISRVTNKITLSSALTSTGVAGPELPLSTAAGSMTVILQQGSGSFWSVPVVMYNGTKLIAGIHSSVTHTKQASNSVVCNSVDGINVGDKVVFSSTMFGGILQPNTVYYVAGLVDSNEFSVSATQGGAVIALTDAFGGAEVVTNDFAVAMVANSTLAKMILSGKVSGSSTSVYDQTVDYLMYTFFGDSQPSQFGYTLPETQVINATASTSYSLVNSMTGDNAANAIVEMDGRRLASPADYSISAVTQQLSLVSIPSGSKISVTSFGASDRQSLHTDFNQTGITVSAISALTNTVTPASAITTVTGTTTGTNLLTCLSTTGFVVNQPVVFTGTAFGSIAAAGTLYYVKTINSSTTFTVSLTVGGAAVALTTATGFMTATVGGVPAVRITTASPHLLTAPTNSGQAVRIDGIVGSSQLNNGVYYVHVISSTQFDLYATPFLTAAGTVNNPITSVNSYVSGGYVWNNNSIVVNSSYTQGNVDRLWVTVNGYRVPSSSLRINAGNALSILKPIIATDKVTVTSMVPSATPNAQQYLLNVDSLGRSAVYAENASTQTWLVRDLTPEDAEMYVYDASKVTRTKTVTTVASQTDSTGAIKVGITSDKTQICQIRVMNNTTGLPVANFSLKVISMSPAVVFSSGVSLGDSLTVTVVTGKTVVLNGEQITFSEVNLSTNTLSGITRGANGTAVQPLHTKYDQVRAILPYNKLPATYYSSNWNTSTYNVLGDPLQISSTPAATFLNSTGFSAR